MNLAIILAFTALVACTAGTLAWFRKELRTSTNELYTVLKNDLDTATLEVKNHVQQFGAAIRTEVFDAHHAVKALGQTDYTEVLKARTDFVELAKGLHAKIDGIETRAAEAAKAAATEVHTSSRRICSFCRQLVHSFEVIAGAVKCTDCKAKTLSN